MKCKVDEIKNLEQVKGCNFFTGVPDSLLNPFIKEIDQVSKNVHVPAVNEAHALAIGFGSMLSGNQACVYLQNSGLGNIINPITSLCIPSESYPFLIIGHRHTIDQHRVMGEIDEDILRIVGYPEDRYVIVSGGNNEK